VRFANNRKIWRNVLDRFPHPYTQAHADAWFASLEGAASNALGNRSGRQRRGRDRRGSPQGHASETGHFGYWLGEPYWAQGIMTAAVSKVAPHALAHFGLARLELRP
jgi:RimJ/RimL family protein N-acetyltransferase